MFIINKWIKQLSQILIDVHKDWGGYRITNIGAPTTAGDALRKGTAITASELPNLTQNKMWSGDASNRPAEVAAAEYTPMDVEHHRAISAVGDFDGTQPSSKVNNNDPTNGANTTSVGTYAEIVLPAAMKITQFRQYGNTSNNGDGAWKIQYKDIDGIWNDWVTGISTRALASWSSWDSSGGEVVAIAIKLIATTVDSSGYSRIGELEVKY